MKLTINEISPTLRHYINIFDWTFDQITTISLNYLLETPYTETTSKIELTIEISLN